MYIKKNKTTLLDEGLAPKFANSQKQIFKNHKQVFQVLPRKAREYTTVRPLAKPIQKILYQILDGFGSQAKTQATPAKTQAQFKANIVQILLLIANLKKKKLFAGFTIKKLKQSATKLKKHTIQHTLKPSSTVTGFKKFMYNFVKLSQNQLQPSYNRRKFSHSHSNQTLKESTRLSRIYAYLSKSQIKSYCAFALKPTHCSKATAKASTKKNTFTFYANQVNTAFVVGAKAVTKQPQAKASQRPQPINQSSLQNKKANQLNLLNSEAFLVSDRFTGNHFKATFFRPIPKLANFLESRLDVIIWRNQLAKSIGGARQKLRQGLQINGSLQKKASFQTLPGDVFTIMK